MFSSYKSHVNRDKKFYIHAGITKEPVRCFQFILNVSQLILVWLSMSEHHLESSVEANKIMVK